jgi:hypothetical protein
MYACLINKKVFTTEMSAIIFATKLFICAQDKYGPIQHESSKRGAFFASAQCTRAAGRTEVPQPLTERGLSTNVQRRLLCYNWDF